MKIIFKILLLLLAVVMVAGAVGYWFFPEVLTKWAIEHERDKAGLVKQEVKIGNHVWPYLITGTCISDAELLAPESESESASGATSEPTVDQPASQVGVQVMEPTDDQRWAAILEQLEQERLLKEQAAQASSLHQQAGGERDLRQYAAVKPLGEYTPGSIQDANFDDTTALSPDEDVCSFQETHPVAPTVVLLHGFSANKDNWVRFAQHLQRGGTYRVIIPDLPAFGESQWQPKFNYDIPHQAKRLEDFLAVVAPNEPVHLVGNSMGGNLAAYYAAFHPEQVASLALFNNSGITPTRLSEMDMIRQNPDMPNPLLVDSVEDYGRLLDFVMEKRPWIPPPVKKQLARDALANRERNAAIFAQYEPQRRAWLQTYLPQIAQPTLIVWGEEDRVIDVSSIDNMQDLLANETVVVMQGVGHVPMIEAPAASAEHYLAFLRAGNEPD